MVFPEKMELLAKISIIITAGVKNMEVARAMDAKNKPVRIIYGLFIRRPANMRALNVKKTASEKGMKKKKAGGRERKQSV